MNTFFGMVEIVGKVCKCGKPPRAVQALNTREDGAGIVWFCREHTDRMAATGLPVQSLTRQCGADAGGTPCGSAATHIAIFGVPGRQGVHAVSVCPDHTSPAPRK